MTLLLYVNTTKSGDFSMTPSVAGNRLLMTMAGTADSTVVVPLRESLKSITQELSRGLVTSVEFDIQRLYLLNSSCLKVLATFVHELSTKSGAESIRFVVSSTLAWQPRALIPLERLAPSLVTINRS